MKRTLPRRVVVRGAVVAGLLVLLVASAWVAADSFERGNRLFRAGDVGRAADIYATWIDTTEAGVVASFNLGNALAELGSPSAERYLLRAAEGNDSVVAQRAHYNLGYRLLMEANADLDPYAAVPLLAEAVRQYEAALKLDPEDADARWNLALALRAFDELPLQDFDEGPIAEDLETDLELSENEEENASSETDAEAPEDESEDDDLLAELGASVAPAAGSPEALASGDPGPMAPEEAMRLVEQARVEPAEMIRGFLWSLRPQSTDNGSPQGGDW